MSNTSAALFLFIGAWLAGGVVLAIVMGRHGHDTFNWLLVGMMFGPIAPALAVDAWLRDQTARPRAVGPAAAAGSGPVDVLVGFDGSPESRVAADTVIALLGGRLGRLTVAIVVPYDASPASVEAAVDRLQLEGDRLAPTSAQLEVLHGHPASTLGAFAAAEGYEVLAAGTRGAGVASHLLGSVANELARNAKVPVLLVSDSATG